MIDFEVAHYGDPAFDVAFLLALVLLDGMRHDDPTFAAEARRFWNVYCEAAGGAVAHAPHVVAELACILLARIDGKSRLPLPVDVQRRGPSMPAGSLPAFRSRTRSRFRRPRRDRRPAGRARAWPIARPR